MTDSPYEPQPGDFGVVSTLHASTGWDRLVARAIQFDTAAPVNHAFVCVRPRVIVEAMPGGARTNSTVSYPNAIWSHLPLSPWQRHNIAEAGLRHVGALYNWLDLGAVGIAQKRWSPQLREQWLAGQHMPWWVNRVSNNRRLICSQLVDLAVQAGNVHLFTDQRLPGLVSPGDLYYWILANTPATGDATPWHAA
jgi:hypothetical protein